MPKVSKKSVQPTETVHNEPVTKKPTVKFTKITDEHKTKLAELKSEQHSKSFKASLRGHLMVGKTWDEAVEKAKAHDAKVKATTLEK